MCTAQVFIEIIPVICSLLFLLLVVLVSITYHPEKTVVKTYERVGHRLKEKRDGLFNYERINSFLMANGAAYHYGKRMDPIKYCVFCILLSVAGLLLAIRAHWILAVVAAVICYRVPGWVLIILNKKDNEKMLTQIRTVYNTLTVQVVAGVYVLDALSECYKMLPGGRLRDALEVMSGEVFLQKSFDTALMKFNQRFNNYFIDSLCAILSQSQESGKAVELLNDLSEQIRSMNVELQGKRKNALDVIETICIVGVLAIFFAIIIYALANELLLAGKNI